MSDRGSGFWEFMRRTYATADPRSLGLLRWALGSLLFVDLARRLPDLAAHYSNDGWLTNHYLLFRPMSSHLFSPHLAFSSPGDVLVLFVLQLIVYFLFTVGYRTRLFHLLSALLLVGVNSRNIAVENGGFVVLCLLTIWTLFLPLGRRFSVDALLASLGERREGTAAALNDRSAPGRAERPVVSLAVFALLLQWAVIYYFNVVHKTGVEWRDGTAVHYFFQQDRMVTALGAAIRDHVPLWAIKAMTYGTLVIEASITVLLLSPFAAARLRMLAWVLVCVLHLSIDAVVQLGPFSYAMMTAFFAFIPSEFWEWARRRLDGMRPAAEVRFDPDCGFAIAVCRWLKRFDGLGKLTFVEDRELEGLAVELGGQVRSGFDGLLAATAVLPMPALGVMALRVPGVPRFLRKHLDEPDRASAYFELDDLPGTDERRADPSAVRVALGSWFGRVREAAVVVLMLAGVSQVLIENRAVPESFKPRWRPAWVEALVIYPRMFQGWSMFAPSPPTDDGLIVVDAVTKDGRRVDPLTGEEPSFDVQVPGGFRMNQLWGDFHRRLHEPKFEAYLEGLREYVRNHPQRTGRPEDELVRFDVFYVEERIPPPGQPRRPPNKRKLLSFAAPSKP